MASVASVAENEAPVAEHRASVARNMAICGRTWIWHSVAEHRASVARNNNEAIDSIILLVIHRLVMNLKSNNFIVLNR